MDALLDCPTCGTSEHAILKAGENTLTVKCLECNTVRNTTPPRQRTKELKLIVSDGPKAFPEVIEVDPSDVIGVDDEFDLNGHRMIVTGLEMFEGKADKAPAADIKVLKAKMFDTVVLKLSVNDDDVTKSFRTRVDPYETFAIGQVVFVDNQKLVIKTIKSDMNRTLHKGALSARNIVRAFCDYAPHWAKEGKIIGTRRRGAPPERKGQAPKSRVKGPRPGVGRRR